MDDDACRVGAAKVEGPSLADLGGEEVEGRVGGASQDEGDAYDQAGGRRQGLRGISSLPGAHHCGLYQTDAAGRGAETAGRRRRAGLE
jgi:hypothetical protein